MLGVRGAVVDVTGGNGDEALIVVDVCVGEPDEVGDRDADAVLLALLIPVDELVAASVVLAVLDHDRVDEAVALAVALVEPATEATAEATAD